MSVVVVFLITLIVLSFNLVTDVTHLFVVSEILSFKFIRLLKEVVSVEPPPPLIVSQTAVLGL